MKDQEMTEEKEETEEIAEAEEEAKEEKEEDIMMTERTTKNQVSNPNTKNQNQDKMPLMNKKVRAIPNPKPDNLKDKK